MKGHFQWSMRATLKNRQITDIAMAQRESLNYQKDTIVHKNNNLLIGPKGYFQLSNKHASTRG